MMDDRKGAGWRRADEVFARALELSGAERDEFLSDVHARDPALEEEVRALLRALEEAEEAGFLDRPAWVTWHGAGSDLDAGTGPDQRVGGADRRGERIGPYVVVERIASGGMATVYRARRADGAFEQDVALKVISAGSVHRRLIGRFLAERQILADLDHPGIAVLLDGGTTEDGLPYLALEYVDGEPITDYCERRSLGVEERLRLFLKVIDAVDHAHRNLVLHRDLKPSNILVTAEGRVKLLDFGIAKMLDPAGLPGTQEITRPGLRPLTPEYASPEQVRGEMLTTASDVYQLGVLLYRLLTGRGPQRVESMTAAALIRAIEENEPDLPSRVVAGSDDDPGTVAARPPDATPKRLRGDLDTVIMKALRKDAERRYASARALAADLRAHLEQRTVSARPDGWAYRARKLVRRKPWLATVTTLLLVVVVGYVWTLNHNAAALERERNAARAEAARANQIRDFLVTVFEGSDPEASLGDTVTARTLLERGARRADSLLAGQPALRADMLDVIGRIMTALGLNRRALPLLEESVILSRDVYGEGSPEVAGRLLDLGNAEAGLQHFDRALPYYREAVAIHRAGPGPADSALAVSLRALAVNFRRLGDPDSAAHYLEEAFEVAETTVGSESSLYARLLTDRGYVLRAQGRAEEAEAAYREALRRQRALLGPEDLEVGRTLNNLAYLYKVQGDLDRAIESYQMSLEILSRVYGRGHPTPVMIARNLASALSGTGAVDSVLAVLRGNVEAIRDATGPDHPRLGTAYRTLGLAHLFYADPADAEAAFHQSAAVLTRASGDDAASTLAARAWVGAARLARGEPAALDHLEQTRSRLAGQSLEDRREEAWTIQRIAARLDEAGHAVAAGRWRSLLP